MQQVNLYLPEFRPRQEWITARALALTALGVILVMVFSALLAKTRLDRYEQTILVLEQQQEQARARVEAIKSRANPGDAASLDAQMARLRESINTRLVVSDLIAGQSLGFDRGYSARLGVFAETVPEGFALDQFRFSGGAAKIELRGHSRNAANIAQFVAQLKNSEAFEEATFGRLSVAESKIGQSVFSFSYGFEPVFDETLSQLEVQR